MGWFRRRRKRRGAEQVAGPDSGAGARQEPDAGDASPAGTPPRSARGFGPGLETRGRRRATGPAGLDDADPAATAGPAFSTEPVSPPGQHAVQDRVPWRHLEDGVFVRLLGPLATDPDLGKLLDACSRGRIQSPGESRLVEETPHAAEAFGRLVGKEQPARPESADLIGGVIRAVALLPAEEAVPLLARLADQSSGLTSRSMPLARSAIRALGTVPGELVPPALHRLASESPLAALRKAAYSELKRRLHTLDDAPEWTVGSFGLDADSRIRVTVGPDHVAVVQVRLGGRVLVGYHDSAGRALAGKPTAATLDPDAMRDAATLADRLRAAVRAARTRLESAQKERREIPTADWLEHYVTHPVTGPLARTLLWDLGDDGSGWRIGLPREVEGHWGLITVDGVRLVPGDGDVLRVAVPRQLKAKQARAWTRVLATAHVEPVLEQIVVK